MQTDQILILVILACTVGLFLWGRWRHDVVAGAALIFGERVGLWRWALTALGFAGVLVILRPGLEGFDAMAILAVLRSRPLLTPLLLGQVIVVQPQLSPQWERSRPNNINLQRRSR